MDEKARIHHFNIAGTMLVSTLIVMNKNGTATAEDLRLLARWWKSAVRSANVASFGQYTASNLDITTQTENFRLLLNLTISEQPLPDDYWINVGRVLWNIGVCADRLAAVHRKQAS